MKYSIERTKTVRI